MSNLALNELLGADLAKLVRTLPSKVVGARPITGLRAPRLSRATFQLRLADGTLIKARRMETAEDAERVEGLAARLDGRTFTQPFARHGVALLEPWIKGAELRGESADAPLMRACGAALGAVHAVRAELATETRRWIPSVRLANLEQRLTQLVTLRALSGRTAQRLAGLAREEVPERVATGIVHRDMWPRNIILDGSGRVRVVDVGSIGYGARAFDLARTAYLWPMTAAQTMAFREGYEGKTGPADEVSIFWAIDVLTDVALFRRLSGASGASRPLDRLRALAAS